MLNNKLKEMRVSCALTQKQVAEAIKIDRSTYTGYETGKSQPPIDTLIKLSKVFGVSLDDILIGNSDFDFDGIGQVSEDFSEYNSGDISFANLTADEKDLVLVYRLLNVDNKKEIIEKILELFNQK